MSYRASMLWGAGLSLVAFVTAACGAEVEAESAAEAVAQETRARGGAAMHDHHRGGARHRRPHPRPGHGGHADGGGASPTDGGASDAGERPTMVRIAAMGFLGDLDVCLRASGADAGDAFSGPVLRAMGLSGGLAPAQVSSYFPIAPGSYELRVISAGAADCATPLTIFTEAAVSGLGADEHRTLVVSGDLARPVFRVLNLLDQRDGTAKVRLVSTTMVTPTLGIGLGTGASFVPWITGVFGVPTGSPPQTDLNGYAVVPPVADGTVTVLIGGTGNEYQQVPNFDLAEGEAVTFFARGYPGGAGGRFQIVTCQDARPMASCTITSD